MLVKHSIYNSNVCTYIIYSGFRNYEISNIQKYLVGFGYVLAAVKARGLLE